MKKLLADEMSKGNESRRRSPSIIARLMGLDGLPAQQNTGKQQKRIPDYHQQSAGSAGSRRSSKLFDRHTNRKDARGQHHFKDVYEIVESPDKEIGNHSSYADVGPNPKKDKIAFVKQKFMDVKRFATDERFQNSKEFHDALEVLDSNKDLLLKFLQEPNSLFAKHLHDLRGVPESHCGHVLSMRTAHTLKSNIDAIGSHSGGEASRKIDISHSQKHWNNDYCDFPQRRNMGSHKFDFLAGDKEDSATAPTRIVVLKPNLGKMQSTASPSPSHGSISNLCLHDGVPNRMHSGSETKGKRSIHNEFDIYDCKYLESREIAREITRRMKNKFGIGSSNVSSSGNKGYSADESSREVSENESSESEVTIASSRTSYTRNDRNKDSTLHHEESSVNKEAKRRLSERWKMTYRSLEVGTSSRGSTLAEMLSIPDMDVRPRKLDIVARNECARRFGMKEGTAELMSPLGISSRDGWKDGCIRNLSRSRSLPSSSTHLLTPKSSTRLETLSTERFHFRKESIDHVRSKTPKWEFKRSEGSCCESPKSVNKKSELSHTVCREMIGDIQEHQFSRHVRPKSFDGKDLPELKAVILEGPWGRGDSNLRSSLVMDEECKNAPKSLNCIDERTLPHNSSTREMQSMEQEPTTNHEAGSSSSLQCAPTQPESPQSSKESEQPSPVSVLEGVFVEDTSSGSECFERVSADLHGLRMQLQLLKRESEAYAEESMTVSSDEDGEASAEFPVCKGFFGTGGESWASSYLADVLNESGLDESDPDLFITTWYSPECPIDPGVFENLERKYVERESCSKLERRQLFDSINCRIIETSQQFGNLHPWVNSLTANVHPLWCSDELRIELNKLLEVYERKATQIASDAEILGGMRRWMELGDHIDAIGRDIEVLLIEEQVAELMV